MIDWPAIDTVLLDMDGTLLDLHFDSHFWLQHLPRRFAELRELPEEAGFERIVPKIQAEKGALHWYCTDYWSEHLGLDVLALKREVRDRIAYRPHTRDFLAALRTAGLRTVIVTNCHPDPLALKLEETGLQQHVDHIYSSHDFGRPKEDRQFWTDLARQEHYDPRTTLMVDDSFPVLESAADAGIAHLLAILAPDSSQPPRNPPPQWPAIHDFHEVLPIGR